MPGPLSRSPVLSGLGDYVRRIGAARAGDERTAAFAELAVAAERAGAATDLIGRFVSGKPNGQRFAMEIAAQLSLPLPEQLIPELVDLVEKARFSSRLRLSVAAKIIHSIPAKSPIIPRIVESLRRKVSPRRAVGRLRRLAVPFLMFARSKKRWRSLRRD